MALASWLLLLKTTGIHAVSLQKKQESPQCYANLRGTLNRYEHLIKVRLHYSVFNLTQTMPFFAQLIDSVFSLHWVID